MASSAGLGLVFWKFGALNSIYGCSCFCRMLGSLLAPWEVLLSCFWLTRRSGLTPPTPRPHSLAFEFRSLNINPKTLKATFHCQTTSLTQYIFQICGCTSPPFKLPRIDHSAGGGKSTWFTLSLSSLLCWPPPSGPHKGKLPAFLLTFCGAFNCL